MADLRLPTVSGEPHMAVLAPPRRLAEVAVFFAVGAAAGVTAYLAIARYGTSFRLSADAERLLHQRQITPEEADIVWAAHEKQTYQNTALSVGILGGVAGGSLGLVAGLGRRSAAAAAGGLLGGVLLGTFFGAVGGLIELFAAYRLWPMDIERTFKTMAAHSAAYLTAGIGIGLAAGLASRQLRRTLGAVLAAALVSGLAYPGLAAVIFPVPNTDAVVPRTLGPLLMWTVMPLALMGLSLGRSRAARMAGGTRTSAVFRP